MSSEFYLPIYLSTLRYVHSTQLRHTQQKEHRTSIAPPDSTKPSNRLLTPDARILPIPSQLLSQIVKSNVATLDILTPLLKVSWAIGGGHTLDCPLLQLPAKLERVRLQEVHLAFQAVHLALQAVSICGHLPAQDGNVISKTFRVRVLIAAGTVISIGRAL